MRPLVFYSYVDFGVSLCQECQKWFREVVRKTKPEAVQLYFELKRRNVPAALCQDQRL
jgi:hypothetical protein